ncbi:3-keto-disaccharide hydrolase [Rubrolithibacter danxiaensis]|uniref:3-keto-disaccharide hydrolase n=1 Tax=Rubrolithibacter danxiaensis TaxID=3390805 RepID=UPI003BF912F9
MKLKSLLLIFSLFLSAAQAQSVNTLTSAEKNSGWKLLFNGKNFNGWHNYNKKTVGQRWVIDKGAIKLNTGAEEGGDIVTDQVVAGDFEFKIDWKIAPYANNGVFFFVSESPAFKSMYDTGLELQVIDNAVYKDEKKDNKHLAADFFGIMKANNTTLKPVGKWNQFHVIHQKNKLMVFLNGKKVQDINLKSPVWQQAVSKSFLKSAPFAKGKFQGNIGIQDWHSEVWYRNIKIRQL